MAKGWVTTARGESLNIDYLITESERPPGLKDQNTEVKKRVIPGKRKRLNVRGTAVNTDSIKAPKIPEEIQARVEKRNTRKAPPPPKVAYREGGVAESYSDLTGIKMKRTKAALERYNQRKALEEGKRQEDIVDPLDEIMEELGVEEKPAPAPKRRTRKKTTPE